MTTPTPAPAPMTAERLEEIFKPGNAMTWAKADELRQHIDALAARVAELEREREAWQAELDEKIGEAEEAAEQHREWPAWAKGILADLKKIGYQYDAGDDIDLRGDFVDHVNEWMRGIERDWKSRALAAEAQLKEAREKLEQADEKVCQAYQIVGSLAHETGTFDYPAVQRALDYLSGDAFDANFLPWSIRALKDTSHD